MDEKIITLPSNDGMSAGEMAALMNNCGGNSNWNNPMWALIFLAFLGNGGLFGRNNGTNVNANTDFVASQLGQAVAGNANAISNLATQLNCTEGQIQNAITNMTSTINGINSNVGMTRSDIMNSICGSSKDLLAQLATCCCENKSEAMKMGYENRIQTLEMQNSLNSRIDLLSNGMLNGFAQVGYNQQTLATNIMQNSNNNTQRLIDTMNNHWSADLQNQLNAARLELSQQAQNNYLISQLKTTA